MSDYYIRSPNDYLEHGLADSVKAAISAALSGRTKSGHKYYKRISLGKNSKGKNKYEYFYSADEYAKWLKNQNEKKNRSVSNTNDFLSKLLGNSVNSIGDSPDILGLNTGLNQKKKKKKKKKKDDEDSDALDDYLDAMQDALNEALEEDHGYKNTGSARNDIKFKEDSNGKDQKGHKYLLRVTLPSGKYRYFYTQKEVDNYRKEQQMCSDVPKQDKAFTDEEQESAVNPQFDIFDSETSQNCWSCALAYDMRQKGYDVQAQHFDGGATDEEIARCYADGKMSKYPGDKDADNATHSADESKWFKSEVNSFGGAGTRGILTVTWSDGGGHAINYEVDDKGAVSIIDSQINMKYSGKDVDDYFSNVSSLSVMRTDNLSSSEYMTEHGDKIHYHEWNGKKYQHHVPAGVASYKDGATDYYNDDYSLVSNDDNGSTTSDDGTAKGYHMVNKKTGKRVEAIS